MGLMVADHEEALLGGSLWCFAGVQWSTVEGSRTSIGGLVGMGRENEEEEGGCSLWFGSENKVLGGEAVAVRRRLGMVNDEVVWGGAAMEFSSPTA